MRSRAAVESLHRVGLQALLVRVSDSWAALGLAQHLRHVLASPHDPAVLRGATEVVPAARTVLVDGVEDFEFLEAAVSAWRPDDSRPTGPLVRIAVEYSGADLGAVATHWGVSEQEVVRRHTTTEFTAAFSGFAPGFSYLSGLSWPVPRLAEPRASVPAGAVGLAGTWCGVYPRSSPGGWQLIGHTAEVLWDLHRDPPALLAPGARVVFEAVR